MRGATLRPVTTQGHPAGGKPSHGIWQGAGGTVIAAVIAGVVALVLGLVGGNAGVVAAIVPGSGPTQTITIPANVLPTPTVTVTVTQTTGGGTPQPAGVFHEGPLTFSNGSDAYLDEPASDPQWGIGNDHATDSRSDLLFWGGGGDVGSDNILAVDSADDTTCQNATGYAHGPVPNPTHALQAGRYLCIITDQKRYALLKVVSWDPTNSRISLYVKVFKLSTD